MHQPLHCHLCICQCSQLPAVCQVQQPHTDASHKVSHTCTSYSMSKLLQPVCLYQMRVLYPTGATPENQSTSDHLSLPIEESDDMLCDNEQGEASMPDMGDETFADASTSETASDDEASDHDEGPVASSSDSEPWASHWLGPGHVIFGHDARRGLQRYDYATGIDTGCVYGKELTACIIPLLPEGQGVKSVRHQTPTFAELQAELVSVPAKQAYTSIRGNIHIPIKDIPIKDRNQGLRPPKPEAN